MRFAGAPSWQMRIDRWDMLTDHALWLRAGEGIDVPAGGIVPGPLDDAVPGPAEPLPDPSTAAEGWRSWWSAIVAGTDHEAAAAGRRDARAAYQAALGRSAAATVALAPWPDLAAVVEARTREFHAWHNARKAAGLRRHGPGDYRDGLVVKELERRLGRPAPPFVVVLLILPVRDDEVRRVGADRYLVPESVYDAPDWADRLEPLLRPLFG